MRVGEMGKSSGARKTAPLGGLVIRTMKSGTVFGRTITCTGLDTAVAPPLSVALAVSR